MGAGMAALQVAINPLLRAAGGVILGAGVPVVGRGDVRRAKPEPDLFLACAERLAADPIDCYVVGDAVWDMLAARRARMLGVGVLTGGYGDDELTRAGAFRVYRLHAIAK